MLHDGFRPRFSTVFLGLGQFCPLVVLLGVLVCLVSPATSALEGSVPASDPDVAALLAARVTAEGQIAKGELVAAGKSLAESLRALPSDRIELTDVAYGNVLLGMFLMEYLMPDDAFDEFLSKHLDTEQYPTDKLLTSLHNIFIGQMEDSAKTDATREMVYLIGGTHQIVRVIALYNACDPYFQRDKQFTGQLLDILVSEYPDLEITQIAQSLQLYQEVKDVGLANIKRESSLKEATSAQKQQVERPWLKRLRDRTESSAAAMTSKSAGTTALSPLLDGALRGSDWKERHLCFLMAKREFTGGQRESLLASAREMAVREEVTPDVLQARILMVNVTSLDAKERPNDSAALADCLTWTQLLVDTSVGTSTPERTLWEDRMKRILSCASNLRDGGHVEESKVLYTELAQEFPKSLVAMQCEKALAEMSDQDRN